jgi:hypothetical protein
MGIPYRDYLIEVVASGARGSADLVAYFFRRVFQLMANDSSFGLLATNSIAEGYSREVALDPLVNDCESSIFSAYPNEPWLGRAAVVTSRIHLFKGNWAGAVTLNGSEVGYVSAYLSDREEWTPKSLAENSDLIFIGSYVLGKGFVLEEQKANEILSEEVIYEKVFFPYLNGRDLNSNPDQRASRWVINFFDWEEEDAKLYPSAYKIIYELVKPDRQRKKSDGTFKLRKPLPQRWWQYADKRPALYHAIGLGGEFVNHPKGWCDTGVKLEKVIVNSLVTKYFNPSLVENDSVFDQKMAIIASDSYGMFAFLNSSIIQEWVWKFSSRMKMDLSFTPSTAFETLPFPDGVFNSSFVSLGEEYESLRKKIMFSNNIGTTKLYNLFHDPNCLETEVIDFRNLSIAIDIAVLDLYGWNDIELSHDFNQVDYLPDSDCIRYGISRFAKDEVIYRMSMLNKERFESESRLNKKNIKAINDKTNQGRLF